MTPHDFIAKWRNGGDERRDFQSFFDDLCRLVGHKTPREADPEHTWFTYEYGAAKTSGGEGWADAWKKGFFGFEAKGTGKDLAKAYAQLKMYADALENPPLLIVSDLQRFEIHTNFTATVKQVYRFTVEDLASPETRRILSAAFHDPQQLRPGVTREDITKAAAAKFAALADALRARSHDAHAVAHFLNRLMFCMFAEDIGLLPDSLFTKLVGSSQTNPDLFEKRSRELFAAMHKGGDVAFENIEWFNGGLFDDDATLRLEPAELKVLLEASRLDWSEIDPSIFGTLFERGLDPDKRSQLGAHYTDPETIMKIVGPVIVEPWLSAWEAARSSIATVIGKSKAKTVVPKPARDRFNAFLERLREFRVLDPACGSGNFLFLALRALKDIEHRVLVEGEALGLGRQFPGVGPASVKGIELNAYAAELARITVWIGEIQWMIQNGYGAKRNPILQPLHQVEHRDALVNADGTEAAWPSADVVIGNPPFIGNKKLLRELGEEYIARLRAAYRGRVSEGVDLVCYWFARANALVDSGDVARVGLVSTDSIRGGTNRTVLQAVVDGSGIFNAWSSLPWVNEGAHVRVSMVCFGRGPGSVVLDGAGVDRIAADLAPVSAEQVDMTQARTLAENAGRCYQGVKLGGPFEVGAAEAREWLDSPNPHGRPNSDVLRRWCNGMDILRRPQDAWLIDFGVDRSEADAAMYERPFAALKAAVEAADARREASAAKVWWRHQRPRPEMRQAIAGLSRWIGTPEVAKHRVFEFMPLSVLPSGSVYVIARDDDTTFGILHSRLHEVWSLRMGTSLEDRPRYTPTSCFETFPFPEGLEPSRPAAEYGDDPRAQRIAAAALALTDARGRWLNPPEWTERVAEVAPGFPERIIPKVGREAELAKRTLTNLYNARPAWLAALHRELDVAVAAAYGWDWPLGDDEILRRLFELNRTRGG